MSQELFPKVELWQLSEHAAQALKEIVRAALVEHGTVERMPVGATVQVLVGRGQGVAEARKPWLGRADKVLQRYRDDRVRMRCRVWHPPSSMLVSRRTQVPVRRAHVERMPSR